MLSLPIFFFGSLTSFVFASIPFFFKRRVLAARVTLIHQQGATLPLLIRPRMEEKVVSSAVSSPGPGRSLNSVMSMTHARMTWALKHLPNALVLTHLAMLQVLMVTRTAPKTAEIPTKGETSKPETLAARLTPITVQLPRLSVRVSMLSLAWSAEHLGLPHLIPPLVDLLFLLKFQNKRQSENKTKSSMRLCNEKACTTSWLLQVPLAL